MTLYSMFNVFLLGTLNSLYLSGNQINMFEPFYLFPKCRGTCTLIMGILKHTLIMTILKDNVALAVQCRGSGALHYICFSYQIYLPSDVVTVVIADDDDGVSVVSVTVTVAVTGVLVDTEVGVDLMVV